MESEKNKAQSYKVPFNILICDITPNNLNNTALLKFLLGEKYLNLKKSQLSPGEKSFVLSEWGWLFTPTTLKHISTKLKDYEAQPKENLSVKHTMLLVKAGKIADNPNMTDLIEQIGKFIPDHQPMTVIITNENNETVRTIYDLIEIRRETLKGDSQGEELNNNKENTGSEIDKSSFSVINDPNNNDRLLKMIYVKLYSICSYYNQLGDQYIFSKDMEEIAPGQVFTQRFNIIVIGRPGSGKSTFINKMLGEKRCLVGGGMSVTNRIIQYHHSQSPISFYDTPGFEDENTIINTINTINSLNTEFKNKVKQIHLILYLMNSQSRTILNEDQKFFVKFQTWRDKNNQTKVPFLFIITKANNKINGADYKETLKYNLKSINFPHYEEIFPIEMSNIYETHPAFGLKEFMKWLYTRFSPKKITDETMQLYTSATTETQLYELNQSTYFLSQMTSKDIILKSCLGIAICIVTGFSLIAGAEGFIPLPFADMYAMLPTQIAMVSAVSLVYGIRRKTNEIKQWIGSLVVNGFLAYSGKFIANGLKLIVGVGTLAGGIISGIVGSVATGGIGASAIALCEKSFDVEKLKLWCITAIRNYNSAIDSFNEHSAQFVEIEADLDLENNNIHEDD